MNSIAHIKPRLGQFTLYKPQSYLLKKYRKLFQPRLYMYE